MYDINEVTQVNKSFIFFAYPDGKQDRKVPVKYELKHLYDDVCKNMKHYDFMMTENQKISDNMQIEYDKLESIITGYENYIMNNQNDPTVRRGLADVCYKLETAKKKRYELAIEKSGVNKSWSYAMNNYWKLYNLQKQIETTLKMI